MNFQNGITISSRFIVFLLSNISVGTVVIVVILSNSFVILSLRYHHLVLSFVSPPTRMVIRVYTKPFFSV
jgi:hypothetical protein